MLHPLSCNPLLWNVLNYAIILKNIFPCSILRFDKRSQQSRLPSDDCYCYSKSCDFSVPRPWSLGPAPRSLSPVPMVPRTRTCGPSVPHVPLPADGTVSRNEKTLNDFCVAVQFCYISLQSHLVHNYPMKIEMFLPHSCILGVLHLTPTQ